MITEIIWKQVDELNYFNELLNLSISYDVETEFWNVFLEDDLVATTETSMEAKDEALRHINKKAGEWIKVGFKGDSSS